MKRFVDAFMRRLLVVAIVAIVFLVPVVPALAADAAAPQFPSLEQFLAMTLRALGAFVAITLFSYYWGYLVSMLSARFANVPGWLYDLVVLLPTAAAAATWNALAAYLDVAFPGVLDQTVGGALLALANWAISLAFARKGGVAQLAAFTRAFPGQIGEINGAQKGILFMK